MVSPSKTKLSRVAANQQQKTASSNKVKLVKGPRPLIHHRFYLDVQKYQLANKIEYTIKELGGKIEFFLNKEITHFITDKNYQQQQQPQRQSHPLDFDGGPSSYHYQQQSPATPTTPLTPRTPLSHPYHHLQYVNEASPSSPCINTAVSTPASANGQAAALATGTLAAAAIAGAEGKAKSSCQPRSRADAMLQRARQQQTQQINTAAHNTRAAAGFLRSRPNSPCSPAPGQPSAGGNTFRIDRNSQSPVQLAKSWGKPIWSTEYAIKFLKKVIETCKVDPDLSAVQKSSNAASRKATNLQHLRGDFIKIESYQRQHRPTFQLFKRWPLLNLNGKSNNSPFDTEREKPFPAKEATTAAAVPDSVKTTTATTNATAKQQTQLQQQCGYCEICRIEYDVLANHLVADEHSAFVNNDSNFVALDKLITDGGVNLDSFLQANRKLVEEYCTTSETVVTTTSSSSSAGGVKRKVCEKDSTAFRSGAECESPGSDPKAAAKSNVQDQQEEAHEEEEQVRKPPLRTYSRSSRGKNHSTPVGSPASTGSSPPAKRTYAGRKAPPVAAVAASSPLGVPSPTSPSTGLAQAQMFGRRSAIHHHPHNTLNHHNHQKAKAARLVQQALLNHHAASNNKSEAPTQAAVAAPAPAAEPLKESNLAVEAKAASPNRQKRAATVVADEMKVLNDSSSNEKEKDRQSKRSAADRMGLKGSTIKPVHPAELVECDGLDPKNTKRISLGLRQNPKRANLNEDFTSILDETLGPMRKPRIRRESAKRVNYSEPREDEIASQEEILQSIFESTAKEVVSSVVENNGKKKTGSPKRPLDVKIRGIRWRAPSPHTRPPIKSPLLYKVIEEPKAKTKKTTSPVKESNSGSSPSKSNKNGLIVKIRRVRQSELSLLNDEAENFMFPKKDDSTDEETDEDRQTTSENGPGDLSQEITSSDYEHRNSSLRRMCATPAPFSRKRTTPASQNRSTGGPQSSPSKKVAKSQSDQESSSTPNARNRRGGRNITALLQDNAEYYKFPDPGSRLRFPEAPIQPNPEVEGDAESSSAPAAPAAVAGKSKKRGRRMSRAQTPAPVVPTATVTTSSAVEVVDKQQQDILLATRSSPSSPYQHQEQLSNCGKTIINYVKGKEDGMGVFKWSNFRRNCKQIEPYRFAFERVPSLEPWYETFQRQDESSEKMYEYFGNTAYRKLPYEMGKLPGLRPNCCILNYRLKSKSPEATGPSAGGTNGCGSSNSSCSSITSSNNVTPGGNNPADIKAEGDDLHSLSLPLKKRKLLVDSDRPRKSPREHASTLAILSLLHQQQQHNRRRTFSGSIPYVTTILPPPSPVLSSAKQQQQEADSALGDEIRSSCGSDPITEKDGPSVEPPIPGANKIKFDPPIVEETFVNYNVMCQELEDFLNVNGAVETDELEPPPVIKAVPIATASKKATTIRQDLVNIVKACDKEPPLTLKLVSRHESIVRKIVQYDRKPRALSAISIKSFDGGGGSFGFFRKRINRTGWPNAKKRIVTRKQQLQHQQQLTVKPEDGSEGVKKEDGETTGLVDGGDGSRKSSTEDSQCSGLTEKLKLEDDEDEDDDEDDEFEDTMTMLDDDEPNEKTDQLVSDGDVEEVVAEKPQTPIEPAADTAKTSEIDLPQISVPPKPDEASESAGTRPLPSSKYVTKTTTTMTRVDYNVPVAPSLPPTDEQQPPSTPNHVQPAAAARSSKPTSVPTPVASSTTTTTAAIPPTASAGGNHEDDDKECDSISSRSIFVSDDCDTTSSTLINMCTAEDPLAMPAPVGSLRNNGTPQPPVAVDPPPPDDPLERTRSRSRMSNPRLHQTSGPRKRTNSRSPSKRCTLQPIVCIEKLNCPSSIRTRSSSRGPRTPVKTYKRSVFTSALVNSSGIPLKRKRKRKHKLNGTSSSASGGSSSPACSDELNSASSSLDCDESSALVEDTPAARRSAKIRQPTPSPNKFSPRKLRKPRGRWYRER